MNIGVGWVSILDPAAVKAILKAPADNELITYLCVGHVDEFGNQPELETLRWEKRKATESVVFYDRYR